MWYYPGYVFAGNTKMDYKLFLGKEMGEYYDPELDQWQAFHEGILEPEPYSEEAISEIRKALFNN
jgi:hypothetical protein